MHVHALTVFLRHCGTNARAVRTLSTATIANMHVQKAVVVEKKGASGVQEEDDDTGFSLLLRHLILSLGGVLRAEESELRVAGERCIETIGISSALLLTSAADTDASMKISLGNAPMSHVMEFCCTLLQKEVFSVSVCTLLSSWLPVVTCCAFRDEHCPRFHTYMERI